jgi:hypothetical protein
MADIDCFEDTKFDRCRNAESPLSLCRATQVELKLL